MSGEHLLDTNIIVALFKNDTNVLTQMATSSSVFVPIIAIGELYYGANLSAHVEKNQTQVLEFTKSIAVLDCDPETAAHYGQIKSKLKAKGRPLPENDVWIAAIARQHSLTVVTRDTHFQEIDSLALESW